MTIVQVPHRPCTVEGAVCTTDGVRLSTRLELVVTGSASPTTTGPGVWSATMTTDFVYQDYGYINLDEAKRGSLTSKTFEVDGETYTVKMIEASDWIYIGLDKELPAEFTLDIDGDVLESEDATHTSYSYAEVYMWYAQGIYWGDGDEVDLTLYAKSAEADADADNEAATGAPSISGTARVGEELTADTSGIADADGLANAAFAYQWVRNDGTDDSDIAGAAASTYTLADADEGQTIKVRVSFSDDAGNDEVVVSDSVAVEGAPGWNATLTVGEHSDYHPAPVGFSSYSRLGSLSDVQLSIDGSIHRVRVLMHQGGDLHLHLNRELPGNYKLTIGDREFITGDSSEPADGVSNARYLWEDTGLDWSSGDVVGVSLDEHDGAASASQRPVAPPSAYARQVPAVHDGESNITFRLHFTEQFPLSFRTLKFGAIEATDGTVTKARRVESGSNLLWEISVRPDSTDDITITLPETTDCAAESAICTADGRKLRDTIEFTIPGPFSETLTRLGRQ